MKTIGFFGTAKNTGKTTTIVSVINSSLLKNYRVGITSIGYDGEDLDNITHLPKPRIFMPRGTVFATAEKTLECNCLDCQVIKATKINSALGKILILKNNKPGHHILSGPTSTNNLQKILIEFEKLGINYVFVDGALNRIAPFSIIDGLIMATGAARTTNIPMLIQETKDICALFKIPSINCQMPEFVTLETGGDEYSLPLKSLLTDEDGTFLLKKISTGYFSRLYVPGLVTLPTLRLLNHALENPLELIFNDVTKLILAGNIQELSKLIHESKNKLRFKVCKPIRLLGITVSPYYPRYRHDLGDYKATCLDKDLLLANINKVIDLPVVNVLENDGLELLSIIEKC